MHRTVLLLEGAGCNPSRRQSTLQKEENTVKTLSVLPELAICSQFGSASCKIASKIWVCLATCQFWLVFLATFKNLAKTSFNPLWSDDFILEIGPFLCRSYLMFNMWEHTWTSNTLSQEIDHPDYRVCIHIIH